MQHSSSPPALTYELSSSELAAIDRAIVELGLVGAAARLGVSREVIARIRGGLGIRRGSVALLRQALAAEVSRG